MSERNVWILFVEFDEDFSEWFKKSIRIDQEICKVKGFSIVDMMIR